MSVNSSPGGAVGKEAAIVDTHPSDASVEMSAEAVLALIDALCGTLGSKILSSILDQPSRSPLCGRRFMALPPPPLSFSLLSSAYAPAQTAHTCDCDDTFLGDVLKDKQ